MAPSDIRDAVPTGSGRRSRGDRRGCDARLAARTGLAALRIRRPSAYHDFGTDRMNVRAATEDDVDELTQIWHDGWHDAHARIVPAELVELRTLKSFRDRLRADLNGVRVLQTSGPIVGLSMMRGAELYQFYVAESFRGSGAAAVLMADAEARL